MTEQSNRVSFKKILIFNDRLKLIVNSLRKSKGISLPLDFYKDGCLCVSVEYVSSPPIKLYDVGTTRDGKFESKGLSTHFLTHNPDIVFCAIPFSVSDMCIVKESLDAISRVVCSDRFGGNVVGIVYFVSGTQSRVDPPVILELIDGDMDSLLLNISSDKTKDPIPQRSFDELREASKKAVFELNNLIELHYFFVKDLKHTTVILI
jgi:hypothetical protein